MFIGPPPAASLNIPFLESVARGNAHFSAMQDTSLNITRQGLFMSAGDSVLAADTVIQHFADSVKTASMGTLVNLDSLVQASPDSLQIAQVNAINPASNIESHLQTLLPVYLRLVWQHDSLSAADLSTLRSIARLCPYQDGYGVLQARAILKRFDDSTYFNACELLTPPNNQAREMKPQPGDSLPEFSLYPNPNSGNMTLTYMLQRGDNGKIIIDDMLGKQLYSQVLKPESNTLNINTNLANGVYVYNIIINCILTKTGKVVIIH